MLPAGVRFLRDWRRWTGWRGPVPAPAPVLAPGPWPGPGVAVFRDASGAGVVVDCWRVDEDALAAPLWGVALGGILNFHFRCEKSLGLRGGHGLRELPMQWSRK